MSDANSGSPLGDLVGALIGVILPGLGFGGYLPFVFVRNPSIHLEILQFLTCRSPSERILQEQHMRKYPLKVRN